MNTAMRIQEVKIKDITVTEDTITAQLMDERTISVPLAWSWRLSAATPKQRANWELIGDGHGVHWPDIDEDISAEGMLYGIPAPRTQVPSKMSLKAQIRIPRLRAYSGSPINPAPNRGEQAMKLNYYPETDFLYIDLSEKTSIKIQSALGRTKLTVLYENVSIYLILGVLDSAIG